jgi:hypothetical protein
MCMSGHPGAIECRRPRFSIRAVVVSIVLRELASRSSQEVSRKCRTDTKQQSGSPLRLKIPTWVIMVPPKANPGSCRHLSQSDVVNLSLQVSSPSASELVEKAFFV